MKRLTFAFALLALCVFGRDLPITNGRLTTDLNANGNSVSNAAAFVASHDLGVGTGTVFLTVSGVEGDWSRSSSVAGKGSIWTKTPFSFYWGDVLTTGRGYTRDQIDAKVAKAGKVQSVNGATGVVKIVASDLNVYTKTEVDAKVAAAGKVKSVNGKTGVVTLDATDVSAYPLASGNSVANTVRQWEGYWGGSNVYWEVTNYIGSTEIPKLRLLELHGEGADAQYREVWNDTRKIEILEGSIGSNYVGIAALREELKKYAPTAWGCYTDRGDTNVVAETTWMANPQTVFAGGTEYQRVAVGDGAICVLTTRGAPTYTAGEAGTFRFQDAGGTNYFGFSKSDSYTIGCNTDGISVGTDGLVTLTYNAIMADDTFPVVYYAASLNGGWEQLNEVDGSAADGASIPVTWGTEGTAYKAYVNLSGVAAKTGFFRAETSVAGGAVFETNMRARLDGGIECVNTANGIGGVIRPKYDGTTVKWEWSAQ